MNTEEQWEEIKPHRVTHRFLPTVTLSAAPSGSAGVITTYIGLNFALISQLGWSVDASSLVSIHHGKGPNSNSIRIAQDTKGLFRIQSSGRHGSERPGARILVKLPHQPKEIVRSAVTEFKIVEGNVLIVELLKGWTAAPEGKREFDQRVDSIAKTIPATNRPEPIAKKVEPVAPKVPTVPSLNEIQPHESAPKPAAKPTPPPEEKKPHGITIMGRFVSVPGMSSFTLMSDELSLFKELLARFGELMPVGGLKRVEDDFNTILTRLQRRLKGSKIMLIHKTNGWLLTWANDARFALEDK